MANYADSTRTPRTLTEREERALLKVTGEHRAGYIPSASFSSRLIASIVSRNPLA